MMVEDTAYGQDHSVGKAEGDSNSNSDPRPPWVRLAKIVAGLLLLPLGIVGLFLPFLQGVLFILIALALLSSEIPFMRRWKRRLRDRYPHVFRKSDAATHSFVEWVRSRWRRVIGRGRERDGRA
jgi:hypothetical protein